MLLTFKIEPPKNDTNVTTIAAIPENIMNDLNTLIGHGGLTLIPNLDHTKYLDSSYGFVRKRKFYLFVNFFTF